MTDDDMTIAEASPPRTVNYKKKVLTWSEAAAIIAAAPPSDRVAGVSIDGPKSPRLVYNGGDCIALCEAQYRSPMAHLYQGARGLTKYTVYTNYDARVLRAYTPLDGKMIKQSRSGRSRRSGSTYHTHGSALGWKPGACPVYSHEGAVGGLDEEFILALDTMVSTSADQGKQRVASLFAREARRMHQEVGKMAAMFPDPHVIPKCNSGPRAKTIHEERDSAIGAMRWSYCATVELHVPEDRCRTRLHVYACQKSRRFTHFGGLTYMVYVTQGFHRYSTPSGPLENWIYDRVNKPDSDYCLLITPHLDEVLDLVQEWCAHSVDVPA